MAGVFSETPIDVQKASGFLGRYANPSPQAQWRFDNEPFGVVIGSTRDSACGPDGIPDAAWRKAPIPCRAALHKAYSSWLDEGRVPEGFNGAYLWLLPRVLLIETLQALLYENLRSRGPCLARTLTASCSPARSGIQSMMQ